MHAGPSIQRLLLLLLLVGGLSGCNRRTSPTARPESAQDYYQRGMAKMVTLRYEDAIEDFDQSLRLDPKLADAYWYRGGACFKLHRLAEAENDYSRAIELDPAKVKHWTSRAIIRQALGKQSETLKDLDEALSRNASDEQALNLRGWAMAFAGDFKGAMKDLDKSTSLHPSAVSFNTRGNVKELMDDPDGAMADYDKAVSLDANNADALTCRGLLKAAKGELRGAMTDVNQVLLQSPDSNRAREARGIVFYHMRQWKQAISDFYAVVNATEPGMQEYSRLFIWVLHSKLGEHKEAEMGLSEFAAERWRTAPEAWPAKTAAFLLGKLPEADFFAAVEASVDKTVKEGRRCEAFYYAGIKRLLNKEENAAKDFFQKCVNTKRTAYVEYKLAKAELKALQGGK